ncbi:MULTISPECIES: DUF3817 domain-containing protein [Leeuwenhoekiella]|jgi:integral membrane protein|uniref:DUF3817 domain-containing protein n=1 Tax=Leeuwenhoekiella blandensis (strain CECT 7118 / CCUG 51940 / KCTC 22103 / MED217) TaxID=398720 RepID=A3XPG6_LEEBM|nr:DUF3817 domain-containing protein [Leeuwenhoekiella blandensis]EAQ48552.1 hypothetical protein MED217_08395 [Leeuwenhoekiella blandensis MED217]MBQ52076.1 DUF3817 domain-containing protein [Leeuwenhoekiella sp.]HBT10382.1 DUF3817 domain-containing protein [Leeuwenhoekiella sp.]HCW65581.1 DUF3817 domain-containing protein [Leeuwenhoekiella sp.]|tara:strand:- start:294 stop:575 length:282 start_codon:yes stop_codon:yes gene_type:complete
MIKAFQIISILEGVSLLLILFVSMPLKYIFDMPEANQVIGMAHGILFLVYVVMAILVKSELNWNFKILLIVLACSIIPFGTFWMDRKYLKGKA